MFTLRAFPMPLAPFTAMRRELDQLVDNVIDWGGRSAFPALNVWEEGDALLAEAEVPGFRLEDLEISLQEGGLTIKGKREAAASDSAANYHRRERVNRAFERTVALPFEIATDKVEATLRDGVLTIRMPKAEAAKPRRIEVKPA